jgi:hypothetical protein
MLANIKGMIVAANNLYMCIHMRHQNICDRNIQFAIGIYYMYIAVEFYATAGAAVLQ